MKLQKRLQKLLGSLGLLTILASCTPKSANAIYIPTLTRKEITTENYKIPVTRQVVDAFVAGEKSFLLYAGSDRCRYCVALQPLLETYIQSAKIELFYIDTLGDDYLDNAQYYFDTFNLAATPTIFVFKNGSVVHLEKGSTNLQTASNVRKFFETHTKRGAYYIDEGNISKRPSKYVTFTYHFINPTEQKIITETFYPLFETKGYNVFLREKNDQYPSFNLTLGNNESSYPLDGSEEDLITAKTALIDYFS